MFNCRTADFSTPCENVETLSPLIAVGHHQADVNSCQQL